MRSTNTKRLFRLALLGGAAAAAVVATPASAATVNSLNYLNVQPQGNVCLARINWSITGVTNDGAGFDGFLYGHVTATNTRNNAPNFASVAVGQTFTSGAIQIGISPTQRNTYFAVIYEANGSGTQGVELARTPIPRADLVAAGGHCATLVTNAAPTNNAGPDQTLGGGGGTVTLTGTASDGDSDPLSHSWSQISGPAVTLSGSTTLTPGFTAPAQINQARTLVFRMRTSDGVGNPVTDDVAVTIPAGPNTAPVASVALLPSTINGGSTVTLSGSASSDFDGDPLTYSWVQNTGPTVTLTGANTATPSFVAPASTGSLVGLAFTLTVSDGVASSSASVGTNVAANAAPTVNAGPDQTGAAGAAVTLAGTATDPETDPLTYQWSQTAGPSVALTGGTTLSPSLTAPAKTGAAQVLTFSLVANDGTSNSAPDTVNITIPANVGPTADAGTDAVAAGGSRVTLAGTVTDGDGDPTGFVWTQVAGPTVALAGSTTANPSFTAPPRTGAAQVLTFQLVGTDGFVNSAADTVDITIPSNVGPVASAGSDATVSGGSAVSLSGTGSDPDNDPVTFAWSQTGGPSVALSGASTASPSFVAPPKSGVVQLLNFSLEVSDGVATASDSVDISIAANVTPNAHAGADQNVNGGQTVTLNAGTSNDPDGDVLTYLWTQVSGPAVTLTGANTATPSFVAPAGGAALQTLRFRVEVRDPLTTGDAPTDLVDIAVAPNSPPIADAGADQGPVNTGQSVTLNGSASTDPDGNTLTYRWTQVSGPAATLSNANTANPSFVAPNVNGTQNLMFELIVNDGTVDSAPDTVTIAVRAVGSVTVIQRVVGADGAFSFTSSISALAGTVTTANGTGQRSATLVPAGSHSLAAGDARAAGYAVTAISCNDADSVVNLASRSVSIVLAPNENLVCTFTSTNTREAASIAIRNFLTARNAAILSHRPDLQRRLDRLEDVQSAAGSASAFGMPIPAASRLPFATTIAKGQIRASASLGMARSALGDADRGTSPVDIWAEAYFASLSYPGQKGRFSIIHTGADYRVGDSALIGVAAQFDRYSPRGGRTAGSVKGHGWMAGPYATFKLGPDLYADVRAAWGKSDNSVSPLDTFIDPFDTTRGLYSGSLIGQFDIGTATQIRPEIGIRYLGEKQKGYTDSLGVAVPSQKVGQGDISFRPRVHHTVSMGETWSLRPFAEVEGIYTFGLDNIQTAIGNDFRMRVEGGADIYSADNVRFGLSAFHDGIGGGGYKSSGVHVTFSVGF